MLASSMPAFRAIPRPTGWPRLDWALGEKPDFVILALGANDALRGIDPQIVRANLDKMIDKITASWRQVPAAPDAGAGQLGPAATSMRSTRIYPELAKAHDVPLYPFFLEGVAMNPALNQPDGLHPNERGVAILVDHIAPLVAKLVGMAKS